MVGEYTHAGGYPEAVRDGVKDMRELSLLPRVPRGKDSLEFLRYKTAVVDLNRSPGDTLGCNGVCQGREG